MTPPLLTTKLFSPTNQRSLVARPRLNSQLDAGFQSKLTLISAPAGFGKSTLLSSWIAQRKTPIAWLSLDDGDNDLARFLSYFIAALQTVIADIGRSASAALQSPGGFNTEILLTNLLNEISGTQKQFTVILDDYHLIESRSVDDSLMFIINHLPPQMHLVISSRIDPSFPFQRMRASGQLVELRADDLRFQLIETAQFLNQIMDLGLSTDQVGSLNDRTEGWIVGLHLAALAIMGLDNQAQINEFIERFTGSDRYIQDYLTEEVLNQQNKMTRDFLLKTSILQQFCSPLCDAVTGQTGSQAVLESLESANLFVIPLDNRRRWFRYHHLFADLLAHNLSLVYPDEIPDLHEKASLWFEDNGFLDQAIWHAQSAGAKDRVAIILESHWQEFIHRGDLAKLRAWLDYLNPEYTKNSPPLSMAYCWIDVMVGKHNHLPGRIKDIRAVMESTVEDELPNKPIKLAVIPSLVETIETVISLDQDEYDTAEAHAQNAFSLVPEDLSLVTRELLEGAAGYWLAQALKSSGKLEQSCEVLLGVLELLKSSENYYGAANTLGLIVAMYQELDKTGQAIDLCEEYLSFSEENHWEEFPPSGLVNVIYADVLADCRHYQAAIENLERGRSLVEQLNSPPINQLVERVEEKIGRVPSSEEKTPVSLTPREIEVMSLLAEGLSNRQICERLFLSLDTIKGHNRRIFAKLGVRNRTQAVNKAISLNIIPPQKTE